MGRTKVIDVPWPIKGVYEGSAFHVQPLLTTPRCQNVRGTDPLTGRLRGAQRPGLSKYVASAIGSDTPIQDINAVVNRASTIERQVQRLAIANGAIYEFTDSTVTAAAGGSGTISTSIFNVFSQQAYGCVYYVDGSNYKRHTGFTSPPSLDAWTPTAGSLPLDGSNRARLIELWGGRITLSGVKSTPFNWFMSAVGDPLDWDYGAVPETQTIAVAGNNSDAGEVGDAVTGMIPVSDDLLIFLCESSVYRMYGNPMAGGRITKVSDVMGGAWGRAWCMDPASNAYFMSSQGDIYRIGPSVGSFPELISSQISETLQDIDQTNKRIRLAWSTKENGFYLFVTPTTDVAGTNYFYDAEQGAWWPVVFAATDHQPVSVWQLEGATANARSFLMGGKDSVMRYVDFAADDDDGTAIDSFVDFQPIRVGQAFSACELREIQATLGDGSDDVDLTVYTGKSAEEAYNATTARYTGTLSQDANLSKRPKTRGRVQRIRLRNDDNNEDWSFESMAVRLVEIGASAQRSG